MAPHAVYTLDAKTLTAVSDLARRLKIPIQIHLAETSAETGMSQERHKMRPVAILDSLKFWAPVTIARACGLDQSRRDRAAEAA